MSSTFKRMIKSVMLYRKNFIAAVIVVVASAGVESLPPRIYSWGIDNIIIAKDADKIPVFVLFYFIIVCLIGIGTYTFIRLVGSLEIKFSSNLRNDIFVKVQELQLQYFNENQDGWIIARMTSDVSKLSEVMSWQFVDSFYFILLIIISIISIASYSLKAGTVVVLIYPILMIAIFMIKTAVLKQFRKVRKQNSTIISKYNEFISGVLTIKTMAIEKQNFSEFEAESEKLRAYSRKQIIISGLFVPAILIIGYIMLGFVLGFGVDSFLVGELTVGEVSAILGYTYILLEVTSEFTNIISQLQNAQANAERIYGLLDTKVEIIDNGTSIITELEDKSKVDGEISFDEVSFKYAKGEKIFDKLSFTIEKGTSVALVGSTGSGKTTLVNLISRFYEPDSGKIKIDGNDIQERSINWLHNNIGHVLQHPFLFNGTVYDNIKYNSNATKEDILKICNDLGLDIMFSKLENGIDTNVGEGGSKLSVGEKQLISFARALANNPSIVILDEATSSIDYESENIIQNVIYKMMESRTMIVIAHRLSTIENCDRILYLKDGEILEDGTHKELIDKKGLYYNLVTSIKQ